MNKIVWIIGVLALFFAGDRAGGALLGKWTRESQFRYSRLYRGEAPCDILLLGNSRGLTFYQPYIEEVTGKNTLNLSYNAMPSDLAKVLIEDYLDLHKAPKKAIIDVTMCDRFNKELISSFNLYTPYSRRLDSLIRVNDPKLSYGGKVSHLYLYNNEIFQRVLYYLHQSDEDWLLDRVISDEMKKGIEKEKPYTITLDPILIQQLKETVAILQSKGTEVFLVINPYYPPFADKITNLEEIKTKIKTATGLSVYDYSKSVAAASEFGDYQHLNKEGSKEYIDLLKKEGILRMGDTLSDLLK